MQSVKIKREDVKKRSSGRSGRYKCKQKPGSVAVHVNVTRVRLSLNCGHQWPLWNNTDRGRKKNSERNLSQWHFVHRKSHMDWHGSEPGPLLWEPSEPWHGQPVSKARDPLQSVISNRFNECRYQSVKNLKLSQYTPLRRLRGEEVYLLLILDLGTRWGWVVSVTPRPHFSPGLKTLGTHCTGGWAP
jgi:hypothetical protein